MFLCDGDRTKYLGLLDRYLKMHQVRLWGWCLMTNHAHLILVPGSESALSKAMHMIGQRFAVHRNAQDEANGHAWEGRYYSCTLGPGHLWTAVRYVERNPVRAGMAPLPDDYRWSSARGHLFGEDETGLLDSTVWDTAFSPFEWREFLRSPDDEVETKELRRSTATGRPLGDQTFVEQVGRRLGRDLTRKKPGRRPKIRAEVGQSEIG